MPHALTNADGWARVTGFEGPAPWVIVATAPGRSPGFATLGEAREGREPVAELGVSEWASMDVHIAGLDTLDLPVSVVATPEILCQKISRAARRSTLNQGRARFTRLAPGRWEVMATVEVREGLPEIIGRTEADLIPGEDAEVELAAEGRIYRGWVHRGGKPIAAELGFRPKEPTPQPPVFRARADEEGRFAVFLPHAGTYLVTVLATQQGIGTTIPGVAVRSPDREIEVELPDGTISGTVVSQEGGPVGGADVVARRLVEEEGFARELAVEARSGDDGEFTLRAVGDGEWRVTASKGSASSTESVVRVQGETRITGLRLVLEEEQRIHGRVITPDGAGVAAAVDVMVSSGGGAAGIRNVVARANEDGGFELSVPAQALGRPASVMVLSVGRLVFARRVVLQDGLAIVAPMGGGQVSLRFPPGWSRRLDSRGLFLLGSDGGLVPLLNLVVEGGGVFSPDGRDLHIPHLGADAWRLVHGTVAHAEMLLGAPGLLPVLAEFSVAPSQFVEVEVDAP